VEDLMLEHSNKAALIITGISKSRIKHLGIDCFCGYEELGNILFAYSHDVIPIE